MSSIGTKNRVQEIYSSQSYYKQQFQPFSAEFARDKQVQWVALCKRLGRERTPTEFVWVVK